MAKKGVNKVILIGNVGGDPEMRVLPNGNPVTNMTIATSETWKDKQTGQEHERTEWHRVVLFGKVAEIAKEYAGKGAQVYIEGRLQTREWEKDGIKRYTTEVVVDQNGSFQILRRAGGDGQQSAAPRQPQSRPQPLPQNNRQSAPAASGPSNAQPDFPDYDSFNDDIPFRAVPFLAMI